MVEIGPLKLIREGPKITSTSGVEISSRAKIRWGCCGLEEDVTGKRYIYPYQHEHQVAPPTD